MANRIETGTDELTGLLNRSAVLARVAHEVATATADLPLSVALLDVDRFASFDHQYGIEAGDALLGLIAKELQAAVPESAVLARYSRDTFLVISPGKSADETFLNTERIRARFDEKVMPMQTHDGPINAQITMSGGVASYPALADNERELIRNAHAARFRAKTGGRARTAFAQPERLETKTIHFAPGQLRRLGELAHMTGRTDASLIREALDDLLAKYYSERVHGSPRPDD